MSSGRRTRRSGRWARRAGLDEGRRGDRPTSKAREEMQRWRRENKRPRMEGDILERAAAWFAKESEPIPGGGVGSWERTGPRCHWQRSAGCWDSPTSGYYDRVRRGASARARRDAELRVRILALWVGSWETPGAGRAGRRRAGDGGRATPSGESGRSPAEGAGRRWRDAQALQDGHDETGPQGPPRAGLGEAGQPRRLIVGDSGAGPGFFRRVARGAAVGVRESSAPDRRVVSTLRRCSLFSARSEWDCPCSILGEEVLQGCVQ